MKISVQIICLSLINRNNMYRRDILHSSEIKLITLLHDPYEDNK